MCFFFCYCSCDHHLLHSFPTRRSSDLSMAIGIVLGVSFGVVAAVRQYSILDGLYLFSLRFDWFPSGDRKSTRLNSSHVEISYAVFCLKKKTHDDAPTTTSELARREGVI